MRFSFGFDAAVAVAGDGATGVGSEDVAAASPADAVFVPSPNDSAVARAFCAGVEV